MPLSTSHRPMEHALNPIRKLNSPPSAHPLLSPHPAISFHLRLSHPSQLLLPSGRSARLWKLILPSYPESVESPSDRALTFRIPRGVSISLLPHACPAAAWSLDDHSRPVDWVSFTVEVGKYFYCHPSPSAESGGALLIFCLSI